MGCNKNTASFLERVDSVASRSHDQGLRRGALKALGWALAATGGERSGYKVSAPGCAIGGEGGRI
jgi:hypothetical protein